MTILYLCVTESPAKSKTGTNSASVSSNRRWMMYKMTKASQERAEQAAEEADKEAKQEKVVVDVI